MNQKFNIRKTRNLIALLTPPLAYRQYWNSFWYSYMKNVIKSSLAAVVLTVQRRGQWQWSGVRKSICRSHFRSSNSGNKKETWIPQHWSDIDMSGYYISTKRRGRICGIIYESLALSNLWTMKSLSWHAIQINWLGSFYPFANDKIHKRSTGSNTWVFYLSANRRSYKSQ